MEEADAWDWCTWQLHKYVITWTTTECQKDPKLLIIFIQLPPKLANCWNETVSVRYEKKEQAMSSGTPTAAFVHSRINIYAKKTVILTSNNITYNNRHLLNIYKQWSHLHVLLPQSYDAAWTDMQTL